MATSWDDGLHACIRSTFKITFDLLYSKVIETRQQWSHFLDG